MMAALGRPASHRKRIAVVQSSYVPWKGFFDLIAAVDEFILYDDVQYTRRDWRNRNQIKTPQGLQWLTVPLNVKGQYLAAIKDMIVADPSWAERHWKTIAHHCRRAPCFDEVAPWLEPLYLEAGALTRLSEVNYLFIEAICRALDIRTRLTWSMDYELAPGRTDRLVGLCRQAGATEYLSGPSARGYMEEDRFREAGIRVLYADYAGYREYRQLYPPFVHAVSVVDLLVNEGANAGRYLKRADLAEPASRALVE
jgi:WbqC-like protein